MAVSAHERLADPTQSMQDAIYGALDAIDGYRAAVADAGTSAGANQALSKRLAQFERKASRMTQIIEDDVLTELLFCVDRLFSVELAERGEFI